MVLADSNILIYATQPEYAKLRRWLPDTLPRISVISRVEIPGYFKLQEPERIAITELLNNLELVYLTPACYEIAIQLRQQLRQVVHQFFPFGGRKGTDGRFDFVRGAHVPAIATGKPSSSKSPNS